MTGSLEEGVRGVKADEGNHAQVKQKRVRKPKGKCTAPILRYGEAWPREKLLEEKVGCERTYNRLEQAGLKRIKVGDTVYYDVELLLKVCAEHGESLPPYLPKYKQGQAVKD